MESSTLVPAWQAPCEALYREHAGRVLRLSRVLLDDPQEAQDVAQEVFVKLLRAYPLATTSVLWGPWLLRVTVNACRDRRRAGWWRWWRTRHDPIDAVALVDPAPTPERTALGAEAREQIWRVFRRLPTRQREVLALRYVEGWSTQEVAAALNLTTGSVKRHLFRAVQRLRGALGGHA
jgi:RNA polymerase sigma-70 factor (ECF subfamily)